MHLKRFAASDQEHGSVRRYRWVMVWLGTGCAVALLLLANTIRNYEFVSRILSTQQVTHQISLLGTEIEQDVRQEGLTSDLLRKATVDSPHEGESLTLRTSDGTMIEHLGVNLPFAGFSTDQEHAAFSRHEPLLQTIHTAAGDYIVQALPVRVPPRPGGPYASPGEPGRADTPGRPGTPGRPDAIGRPNAPGRADAEGRAEAPGPPGMGPRASLILEAALPLKDADPSVLGPVRRNLIIDSVAALSLLLTVVLAWAGLRSYEQGRRFEEQIEIAREVQSRLLPSPTLEPPGIQIATEYQPSEQVGGDFYDLFSIPRGGLACLIGDVSGKGIPAALLMGVIHGAVRTAEWQSSRDEHEAASGNLNRLLCERASDHRFASMFWCVYDQALGSLRYVNAGHNPPLLISRRNGTLLTNRLDRGGPVLGLLPEAIYEAATIDVCHGDLLVMYSDGLVEANNAKGEEYGEEKLSTLLASHIDETPAQLRARLLASLATFASPDAARDDLTLSIVRF